MQKIDLKKKKRVLYKTPFGPYMRKLDELDKGQRHSKEFASMMILGMLEELGEMARAYLAKHGRKPHNLAAQADEKYEQEMGDLMVVMLRFARIKKINLHEKIMYSLRKMERRKTQPKTK
jgi:NTP pyrophosphatase (non-canonical NTP hydrolase)